MLEKFKHVLIDLFETVLRIEQEPWRLRATCLDLQERLITERIGIEHAIQQYRHEAAELNRRLHSKDTARLDKREAQSIKSMIQADLDGEECCKQVLQILGTVGDALVHIYFPTWDIKHFSFKESCGFISGKKGLEHERTILRSVFEAGSVAIMSDLTNSVRYGDIVARGERGLLLIEAKSSGRPNRRVERQRTEADKLMGFLAADSGVPTSHYLERWDGCNAIRVDPKAEAVYHWDKLHYLIKRAYRKGFASREVESGLFYVAVTTNLPGFTRFARSLARCIDREPLVYYLNRQKESVPGYRPLVLSVRNPDAAYDFYNGTLSLIVIIEPKVVEDTFASHGLAVTLAPRQDIALEVRGKDTTQIDGLDPIQVGQIFFLRIPLEVLSLSWALRVIISIYNEGPALLSAHTNR